jgi:hypothetical protein
MSTEMKRLSMSYGFEVASRSSTPKRFSSELTTRTMAARAVAIFELLPTPETDLRKNKKKKKKKPYAGASGPFSRKHNWSGRKKRRSLPSPPEFEASLEEAA